MNEQKIKNQYDQLTRAFSLLQRRYDRVSDMEFYRALPSIKNQRLLDAGCGNGNDLLYYKDHGAFGVGIDCSPKMVLKASRKNLMVVLGSFEDLPFKDNSFDVTVSKYAIQDSGNVRKALSELARVTKPGGVLQYLAVHPFRQFLERKQSPTNYFKQIIVESNIFDSMITVYEPTHTFNEYLNPDFLQRFDVTYFSEKEQFDGAAEQINGNIYPCYFIIRAKKRY